MTHQELRQSRILAMQDMILEANTGGLGFVPDKLLAKLSIEKGLSKRTAQEYLSSLMLTGRVIEVNGELWIPSAHLSSAAAETKSQEVKT